MSNLRMPFHLQFFSLLFVICGCIFAGTTLAQTDSSFFSIYFEKLTPTQRQDFLHVIELNAREALRYYLDSLKTIDRTAWVNLMTVADSLEWVYFQKLLTEAKDGRDYVLVHRLENKLAFEQSLNQKRVNPKFS